MRYENAERLFDLALWLQRRSDGVSLQEIQDKFEISLRTAQRMRDTIERIFGDLVSMPGDRRELRWRLPHGSLSNLAGHSAKDFAALDHAILLLRKEGGEAEAKRLALLEKKLRTVMRPVDRLRLEADLEYLIANESYATKPGPSRHISEHIFECLQDAILRDKKVKLEYESRKGNVTNPTVEPYGFLFGNRHYLLAINPRKNPGELRKYILPGIRRVTILKKSFNRSPDIDLDEYANRSFGVYAEPEGPFDIEWRFSTEAADTASEYEFHPTQKTHRRADGSLIVKFRACGLVEMAWHLLKWGKSVEVIKPARLRKMLDGYQKDWGTLP